MALSAKAQKQVENYDRITFRIPKGNKTTLQLEAAKRGKTINDLVVEAIEKQYSLDLTKKTDRE